MGEWHVLARSDQHSKRRQTSGWVGPQVIDYLQNNDGMLGRILFQQVFEVRGAGAQNHLVGLGVLALMIRVGRFQICVSDFFHLLNFGVCYREKNEKIF